MQATTIRIEKRCWAHEEKMAKADKTKRILIFCLIITVMTFIKVMFWSFGDLDELWNYNMSRGVVMGLVPYRDFNMVMTPLYAFISSIALLVCRTLIAYRISCSIILSVLMLLVFKAVSEKTNPYYALPSALLCLLFSGVVTYNTLFMIFALIIYLLLLQDNSGTRNFLTGLAAAGAALSRQTSGGILILILFVILAVHLDGEAKGERKIKDILLYLAGGLVPCTAFLIYLLATGAFASFWDYCFFGLFTFGNGNGDFQIAALPYLFIALLGIICDISFVKTDRKTAITHLLTGIPVLLISFPIIDSVHTSYAAIWFLIPVVRYIENRFGRQLSKKISVFLSAVLAIVISAMTVFGVVGCGIIRSSSELKGVLADGALTDDYYNLAEKCQAYEEQGYKVTVLSNSAVLVSIVKGDIDPVFDMFNKGNFGVNEPLKYIQDICCEDNSLILMPDDYPTEGWQNPEGVYEYVTSHCEEVDSYGRFKLYKPV